MIRFEQQRRSRAFYKWLAIVCALFCIGFLIVTLAMAITFWIRLQERYDGNGSGTNSTNIQWPAPSGSLFAKYRKSAIATDNGFCSEIGRDVMFDGGNAIDAAIAGLMCTGLLNPQSSGAGGGFLMTIYNATTKKCLTVNARETAPLSSTPTMFVGTPKESVYGYRAIGVPGEIHGLWTIFTRYGSGKVTWPRLLEPTIRMGREGFPISSNLAMILKFHEANIRAEPEMRRTFINPDTEKVYEEGDKLKRVEYANLLQELANSSDPLHLFYRGRIAQEIADEMQKHGGHITKEDLRTYNTEIDESPLESDGMLINGLVMCGPKPPGGTSVTIATVGIIAHFYPGDTPVDLNDPLVYHRLIEAQKFAYAQRTKLGDADMVKGALEIAKNMTQPEFVAWISSLIQDKGQALNYYSLDLSSPAEDHGTSHISALDVDGNGVSVTSTVNQWLGAMRVSPKLGIIWNNEMDDFSTPNQTNMFGFPPSPENFIAPRKRPQSSMAPMVIYNKTSGSIKMVIGASGGARIISAMAQTIIRTLLFNQTIKEAVDAPRIHNQFIPFVTEYEIQMPEPIIESLHNEHNQTLNGIEKQATVIQALLVAENDFIHGNSDFRRKTATFPAGF